MKKIYLVKKDPEKPASKDNWIIMNSYEFAMFLKTPEGEKRKSAFRSLQHDPLLWRAWKRSRTV